VLLVRLIAERRIGLLATIGCGMRHLPVADPAPRAVSARLKQTEVLPAVCTVVLTDGTGFCR
jgi:hypothetical protein